MNQEATEVAEEVSQRHEAKQRIQKVRESWEQKGAEFLGSQLWLSVSLRNKVSLTEIRNAIINDPVVPNEWAPEKVNELSVYNNIVTSLKRKGMKEFEQYASSIPFDKSDHAGYMSERIHLTGEKKTPRRDKVFRLERSTKEIFEDGEVVDKQVEDVKVDQGVHVWVTRENHEEVGPEGDETGETEWSVDFEGEAGAVPDDYLPYVETLAAKFEEKQNELYDSTQVRELILNNMILDDEAIDAINMAQSRGLYFVPDQDIEKLEALADLFENIDSGIQLHLMHVPYFEDAEELNQNFENVRQGVMGALQEEVQELKEELERHHNSDKNTRPSTYIKREKRLYELKQKLSKFQNQQMFELELVKDDLRDMEEILEEHIHDDEDEE